MSHAYPATNVSGSGCSPWYARPLGESLARRGLLTQAQQDEMTAAIATGWIAARNVNRSLSNLHSLF